MERQRPRAVFMAFGTKGDVYPIAAVAAAFASDQQSYDVMFVSHSIHESLKSHLRARNVKYYSVSSPPVLSISDENNCSGLSELSFSEKKKVIQAKHRHECLSITEGIFGVGPTHIGDIIVINFFALEGWNIAELFHIRCVVVAPYVVPYSAPASFERQFKQEFPELYRYLQEAAVDQVNWKDVLHWMWPLFTEEWGLWRNDSLNLSPLPFTDPVTCLPMWHLEELSPLLLYGFSKEIVECPGYWPSNVHICGFWFLPMEWQFSCRNCAKFACQCPLSHMNRANRLCSQHVKLQNFLEEPDSLLIFVGLSSIGSMGFIQNPRAFLLLLNAVLEGEEYRILFFTSCYKPLDDAILSFFQQSLCCDDDEMNSCEDGTFLFNKRFFCFTGSVPYRWLFLKCAVAIHHGGSGSTAAALHAGIPQIACPFHLDQFYWAERMHWLGVSPEPLHRNMLVPESDDHESIEQAARGLKKAIKSALSPQLKARAQEIKEKLSSEDGIQEAVKVLKEKIVQYPHL